jgi:hypothetical protein
VSSAKTLHETLADLGWSSSKTSAGHKSGRTVRCGLGHDLGVLTAGETWDELRARGLIDGKQPEPPSRFHCACTLGSLYGGRP